VNVSCNSLSPRPFLFFSFLYVWIPWLLYCCKHKWSNWSWSTWQTCKNTMRQSFVITQLYINISTQHKWLNDWSVWNCSQTHTHAHSWIYAQVQTTWFFMHIALFFFQVSCLVLAGTELIQDLRGPL
jgi:hypothetical protein